MNSSLTGGPRRFNAGLLALLSIAITATPAEARKKKPVKVLPKAVRIQTIQIETKNVFDPEVPSENYWPYRLANVIHIRTRAGVIRRQLLFRPGDEANPSLFDESERNLRALPFIKDAKIQEVARPDGDVDLLVKTQDTWTLEPQINFGTQGGQSTFSTGVLDENFLGYGKTVSAFYTDDINGVNEQFGYVDPQIGNTRMTANTNFKKTSTGDEEHVSLARPFYALETRWAGGAAYDRVVGLQKVYDNGGVQSNQYENNHVDFNPFVGRRLNDDPLNVQRLQLRYEFSQNLYTADPSQPPLSTLPANNTLSGPLLTWTYTQSNFIKETYIDKAERVEDYNLGHQATLESGYSTKTFGATQDSVPFSANDSFGFGGDGPWFGLTSIGAAGRFNPNHIDPFEGKELNTLYFMNLNLYRHLLTEYPVTGAAHFESTYLDNPDTANQIQLGGDTGLRGYPVRSFTGNKSVLGNVETRFFFPYEVLHLAYIGGAVFSDVGEVEPLGTGFRSQDVHADIGAGFRFALTRSTVGSVYRVDFAYALGPVTESSRWIVSITSGQGFARSNNSAQNFPEVSLP